MRELRNGERVCDGRGNLGRVAFARGDVTAVKWDRFPAACVDTDGLERVARLTIPAPLRRLLSQPRRRSLRPASADA